MASEEIYAELHDEAQRKYYHERDYEGARELFERVVRSAEARNDQFWELHNRAHVADCYTKLNRYDLAVNTLEPVLDRSRFKETIPQIHDELSSCVSVLTWILIDLPAPLKDIERAIRRLDSLRESKTWSGETSPRLRHLFCNARLLTVRGFFEQAKALYLSMLPDASLSQRKDILLLLSEVCIDLKSVDDAKRYLEKWATQDWYESGNLSEPDEAQAYKLRSRLSRLGGMPNEALRMIERAEAARQGDDRNRLLDSIDFIRAQLAVGDLQAARTKLASSLSDICSPRLVDRFEIMLVAGDYRLSCAGEDAGLDPCDYQFGCFRGDQQPGKMTKTQSLQLDRANRWYRKAERLGKELDRRLECTCYTDCVYERNTYRDHFSAMMKL